MAEELAPHKPKCPECGSDKVHYLGVPGRAFAQTHPDVSEHVFICEVCGAQFQADSGQQQ